MKKPLANKTKVTTHKKARAKVEIAPATETPSQESSSPTSVTLSATDPRVLLHEAEQEPEYVDMSQYAPVIGTLRGKGFSYRAISEWFSERGMDLNHNAVYRIYINSLSDLAAHHESEQAENEEREEAFRNS